MTSTAQNKLTKFNFKRLILSIASFAFLALANHASQAATDLATLPLNITGTSSSVLPNIMYILDNSGSMARDYMPDYVNDSNKCKTTGTTGIFSASCGFGDPPYNTSEFNSIYYNPAITYSPGINADKSERPSRTSADTTGWTIVPIDAYGIQSAGNTSLVPNAARTVGYPDRVWCNTTSASAADLINPSVCKQNSQYIYPNNTGAQATSFNQPYTLRGNPYYYTVAAGEYCTDKNLTTCIAATAPSTGFAFPAKLRWCNSSARTNCQAKYIEGTGYTFARWTGISLGTSSSALIRINADTVGCGGAGQPSCTAPSAMNITDITVDAVRIVATPVPTNLNITNTTSNTSRNTLAINIAGAINAYVPTAGHDFTATASGDEVTVTRVGSGTFLGTIDVIASTVNYAGTAGVKAQGRFSVTKVGKDQSTSGANTARCNNASNASTNCPVTIEVSQVRVGSPSNTNITSGTITYSTGALNSASGSSNTTKFALATLIKDNINTTLSSPFDYTATCGPSTAGSGVTCTTEVITITAVAPGTATHGNITITSAVASNALGTINTNNLSIGLISNMGSLTAGVAGISAKTYTIPTTLTQFTGGTPTVNSFNRVDIEPTTASYPKAVSRTDCGDSTVTVCTYAQEMTNFANWYSYYRTRMQMMKTSTSRAFKDIDSKFRVGFITIANQSTNYVPIADFNLAQKTSWYNQLLATNPTTATPLRSALSLVGRIFAGKKPVGTDDPVQFSCQQNYAILTTDGYWNGGTGAELDGTTAIGNLDGTVSGVQTPRPLYEGPTAVSNSLADVAKYYYETDLRTGIAGSAACTGSLRPDGTTGDVCANNVFVTPTDNNIQQHMTTFTLGLGVDATLTYDKDYKTATSGDFFDLTQGSLEWSTPAPDSQSAVDDLWHAAVNGQGTYFSAKNPTQLSTSLSDALSSIKIKTGSGAAAATSTLQPVKDDNFAYVASYTSMKWTGNLEKRTVSTTTGTVSRDAVWCIENVSADTSCEAPGSIIAEPASDTNGNTAKAFCVTPGATASTCSSPSILDGSNCKVEVATECTGTLKNKVTDVRNNSDLVTRKILMNVGGTLADFSETNLAAAGKATNFSNAFLQTKLTQWSDLTVDQRAAVNEASLVNFLRGNRGFEDRTDNLVGSVDHRIYRLRESTLGDLANSPPVFVGSPKANYNDPGYGPSSTAGTFKNAQNSRAGTVYVGSNDGMLHAFNALTGEERWAFFPSAVIPELYRLADKKYGDNHSYFVDGELTINDICTANCTSGSATWKTVLIAGFNGGGKGYFALDITNPTSPELMWEYGSSADYVGDTSFDSDLGYSYGNPVVTKKADGTWVVLITSGYNNASDTGFLSVLNAVTGNKIGASYTTGASDGVDSGLAKINGYVEDTSINNTVSFVYGGDLLGNLWRFDINSAPSSNNPFKLAELKGPANKPQPITVKPELGNIEGKRVVFVGTGRYLGKTDLNNTDQQTFYAISDDNVSTFTTLVNPRASSVMVQQVLVNDASTGTRSVQNAQDVPSSKRGWFFDFPDAKERQNVPAQLVFGTLLVPSTVPENTDCSPGGYGWLNFLDYKTGKPVSSNIVAVRTNAPIVGLNVLYVGGKPVINIVTSGDPTPTVVKEVKTLEGGTGEFTNHRVIWRELTDEE